MGRCLPAGNILVISLINLAYLFSKTPDCFRINSNLVFAFLNLEVTNVVIHYLIAELGCVVTVSVQCTHD